MQYETLARTMDSGLRDGAKNLLITCAGLQAGDSIVIFHEDPALGWYDLEAPNAVADVARSLGMSATLIQVNAPGQNEPIAATIEAAMEQHDQTVYFSRLGDQDRFAPSKTARPAVMVYATDAASLSSQFGWLDHNATLDLKSAINSVMSRAREIRVTCSAGTDLHGSVVPDPNDGPEDVEVKRFPMGVFKPLPMTGFSGRVAVTRYLTPTGSKPYSPAVIRLENTLFANVRQGAITGFEGSPTDVERAEQHYRHVSDLFGIEPMLTHSWHSGFHPACEYFGRADDNPDKWGNYVFCNPRVMHCHTCGDYPPGEICWMVFDPEISVDGKILWRQGRMDAGHSLEFRQLIKKWPMLGPLLENPCLNIGVD